MVTAAGSSGGRGRLHLGVATAFEERILSGALAIGARMPSEGEIARDFGVSIRSVREAMQLLETKGLVRRRHGERAEVVRDDFGAFAEALAASVRSRFAAEPEYLVELMDVRRMFEEEAAGRLAGHLPGALAGLERALEGMARAVSEHSFPGYVAADAAFHLALVEAVGNGVLLKLYQNLFGLITEIIRLSVRVPSKPFADGLAEHRDILAGIRTGDPATARGLAAAHVEQSKSYLQRALAGRSSGKATR